MSNKNNINLSVDGGGTSLRIVAFDDDLNFIAEIESGSVNPNFESIEKIEKNMSDAIKHLFEILKLIILRGNIKINNVYETIVGSVDFFNDIFMQEVKAAKKIDVADFHNISESHSHLFAASLKDFGGVALAGTGSGAIYCDKNNKNNIIHSGGYGIPVGDEGSGAWIGVQGMSAAIRHINGWGEKTLLTEKLYQYLNIINPDAIIGALYRKGVNQRRLFAGFCKCVAECERLGDKIAKDIIYSAGRDMGLQMISVLKQADISPALDDITIYASGGAWKGTPYMLEVMTETIHRVYPDIICTHGLFDPVMGGVIKFIFDKNNNAESRGISKSDEEHLKKEFGSHLFKFNKNYKF